MNNNHQSITAALTAFQSSLERINMSLVDSFKPSLLAPSSAFQPALLEFQRSIAQTMTISLQNDMAIQLQAQLDALTAPVRQMQEVWNASLVSGIRDTLAVNDSVIQELTKNIQQNLIDISSHFSVDFSSALQNISFYSDHVEVPEELYTSLINEEEYECDIPLATVSPISKRRITLEFFLSYILPNIIALFGVWLTIHFHNIDSSADAISSQAETVQFEKYTESLEKLNLSVTALIDCLNTQPENYSFVATDSNSVLEVPESDSEAADVSDNPDTPRQPD